MKYEAITELRRIAEIPFVRALKEIADALPYPCPYDTRLSRAGVKKETLDILEENGYVSSYLAGYIISSVLWRDRWYQLTERGQTVVKHS